MYIYNNPVYNGGSDMLLSLQVIINALNVDLSDSERRKK